MHTPSLATRLRDLLALTSSPVAISFTAEAPAGVPHIARSEAASCSYWPRAAAGESFFTDAADHLGCPVGAHTHGVPMGEAKAKELGELVQIMVKLDYLSMEDVARIPTRKGAFGVVVYAPLEAAVAEPDVVVVKGNARQVMLLAEAARGVGAAEVELLGGEVMGRPACAMLPQAMQSGRAETSLGCIGNRVYTGLGDNELYFAIPGARLTAVVEKLNTIVAANQALAAFHTERRERARAPLGVTGA